MLLNCNLVHKGRDNVEDEINSIEKIWKYMRYFSNMVLNANYRLKK